MKVFVTLWLAQLVSVIGSALSAFGLGAWVVQQTGRTTDYAMIGLASSLPAAILTPVVGVLVDRWPRRAALLIAEGGGLLASVMLATAGFTGHLQLWMIWISAFVHAIAISFTWPALSAVSTLVVPKKHLARTVAMLGFSDAIGMILGPVIGGLMLLAGGLTGILAADVASFVLSIILILASRIPDIPASASDHAKRSIWEDIQFAWQYVRQRPGLFGLLTFFLVSNFVWGMAHVLMLPLLLSFFNAGQTGRIVGVDGLGVLAATLLVGVLGAPKRRTVWVLGFNALAQVGLLIFAAPPHPWLYGFCFFCMAFFGTWGYTCSQNIWQSKVDPALQGRVFSIRRMMASLATPLSMVIAGPLADRVFGPGMQAGGFLAPSFSWLLGTGQGAGIRLLFLALGVIAQANSIRSWFHPHIRNIDRDIPDFKKEAPREALTVV